MEGHMKKTWVAGLLAAVVSFGVPVAGFAKGGGGGGAGHGSAAGSSKGPGAMSETGAAKGSGKTKLANPSGKADNSTAAHVKEKTK
jgi:hypothetical protein